MSPTTKDAQFVSLGPNTNVESHIEGNVLTLRIDLTQNMGPSKSGKTILLATTGSGIEVQPGVKLGLNLYRKIK